MGSRGACGDGDANVSQRLGREDMVIEAVLKEILVIGASQIERGEAEVCVCEKIPYIGFRFWEGATLPGNGKRATATGKSAPRKHQKLHRPVEVQILILGFT